MKRLFGSLLPRARLSRKTFLIDVVLLAVGKAVIDLQVIHLRPDLAREWSWSLSWLNPYHLVRPGLNGDVAFLICLTTLAFFAALIQLGARRARDAGRKGWIGWSMAVPLANLIMLVWLAFLPHRRRTVWDLV